MEPLIGRNYYLEICANSVESALAAQEGGASRIELCQQLEVGGVTPSAGQIVLARELLTIGVHVLIRPRAGDFCYSEIEFEEIRKDVEFCRSVGCDGVVIGVLLPDGRVDEDRTRMLVELAGPMTVTFHRAFDRSKEPFEALETIINAGCHRLLTSGQQDNAIEGVGLIKELVEKAGRRLEIMPGSGVTEDNIVEILRISGARSIHSSAKVDVQKEDAQKMDTPKEDSQVVGGLIPTGPAGWIPTWVSSKEKVRTMADLMKSLSS